MENQSTLGGEVIPVVLAGGGGSRLWPLSGEHMPKQFLPLSGNDSLFRTTIKRLMGLCRLNRLKIVCGPDHCSQLEREMETLGLNGKHHLIVEPCSRNTAPAILLAAKIQLQESYEGKRHEDPIIIILPVDHFISDVEEFHKCLRLAVSAARDGAIAALGITPNRPETGYGYIEAHKTSGNDSVFPVLRFVEKPDRPTAENYVASGDFFWNAGIFVFKASTMLEEFQRLQPKMCDRVDAHLAGDIHAYAKSQRISIDFAIMEHTKKAVVAPAQIGWSDLGSWSSVHEHSCRDILGNSTRGQIHLKNCRNSYFHGEVKPVVGLGVENLVVVDTPEALLVAHASQSQKVGKLASSLPPEFTMTSTDQNSRQLTEQKDHCQISRLEIAASSDIVICRRFSSSWTVVSGVAFVECEDLERQFHPGEAFSTVAGQTVRIQNNGNRKLSIIEVRVFDQENAEAETAHGLTREA